ncbi:ribosome silencing factor [Syntrophobacter fumaroxidans]|nr:ribosome silencing factor [Syntrophobacter fumaroxidans]
MDSKSKAFLCAEEADKLKAADVVLLEVSKYSSFADYFVICSGKSGRQVQGIADSIERSLKEAGIRPLGVEGLREGQWVLMDYGDVIVHVFYEPVRFFYDLESLWSEAETVRWNERSDRADAVKAEEFL